MLKVINATYGKKLGMTEEKFARTLSEAMRLFDFIGKLNIETDLFSDEMAPFEDGSDTFYAGLNECKKVYDGLPECFIITNDMDGKDNIEEFKVTKKEGYNIIFEVI